MISRFIYNSIKEWIIKEDIDWTDPYMIDRLLNEGREKYGKVFDWAIEDGVLDEI